MPAPIAPWMSGSDALVIWMFSTAMKAPMIEPMTASQTLKSARGSSATLMSVAMAVALSAAPARWPPVRVSIVGSTDMPGRSRPASATSWRSMIFTGMRWTILVKLPVALSGGSSANSWPLAGAMLSTTPWTT